MLILTARLLLGMLFVCMLGRSAQAAEPIVLDLWPGRGPGDIVDPAEDTVIPPRSGEDPPTLRLTNITRPQITVYRPAEETNTGAAMLVLPGGGFNHLAYDKEGTEAADWLAARGITGVVLKYRCPTKQDRRTQHVKPLQDTQRAMSLVRSRAEEWGIDPQRLGVLGFSAGGHIAARLALHEGGRTYDPIDAADEQDWQLAFAALLYPAYLTNEAGDELDAKAFHVKRSSPPMFIAYACDDKLPSPGALHLAIALKQAEVPCELHQYVAGGHGFGMRAGSLPASTWPARLEDWLQASGVLTK